MMSIMFNEYGCLPEGIHKMTWDEVKDGFSFSPKRLELIIKFEPFLVLLTSINCSIVYLDGSFVTDKLNPRDIDVLYDNPNIDEYDLYMALTTKEPLANTIYIENFKKLRDKYGVDIKHAKESCATEFRSEEEIVDALTFFQRHKQTSKINKGIIQLNIS